MLTTNILVVMFYFVAAAIMLAVVAATASLGPAQMLVNHKEIRVQRVASDDMVCWYYGKYVFLSSRDSQLTAHALELLFCSTSRRWAVDSAWILDVASMITPILIILMLQVEVLPNARKNAVKSTP